MFMHCFFVPFSDVVVLVMVSHSHHKEGIFVGSMILLFEIEGSLNELPILRLPPFQLATLMNFIIPHRLLIRS